jgi:hypothetical protein
MITGFRNSAAAITLLLLASGAAAQPAVTCECDVLSGNFGALHPKSIGVAFAIRDSVDAGVLERLAVDPIVPGSAAYGRAVDHLNAFQRRLSAAAGQTPPSTSVSVLLIDSNFWARLTPAALGFDIEVHTDGAQPDDVVVLSSEVVLTAVLEGCLSVQAAFDRGVLVIDGPGFHPGTGDDRPRLSIFRPANQEGPGSKCSIFCAEPVRELIAGKPLRCTDTRSMGKCHARYCPPVRGADLAHLL